MVRKLAPEAVSRELARIAMSIETSSSPSLSSVERGLRRVVASMSREASIRTIASKMVQLAAEDVELSLSDIDGALESRPDRMASALENLRGDIDSLIEELAGVR